MNKKETLKVLQLNSNKKEKVCTLLCKVLHHPLQEHQYNVTPSRKSSRLSYGGSS